MTVKAAGIIFTDGKSVLLLKRAKGSRNAGTWGIPGGKLENGETPEQAAEREAMEETGLKQIPGKKLGSITVDKWATLFYRVEKRFSVKLNDEHSNWKWVSFKKLKETKLHPSLKGQIKDCLKMLARKAESFVEWLQIVH